MKLMKKIMFRLYILSLAFAATLQFSSFLPRSSGALALAASGSPYSTEWRITGPTGGDVRGLVVDPNDPARFYFGTLDGQIYT